MNIPLRHSTGRARGVSLIECLAYMAVLVVVTTVAVLGFNRCWDDSKHLRRNADEIVRALHAGEQWRADVRSATGPIAVGDPADSGRITIPGRSGNIIYTLANGELHRQAGASAPTVLLLAGVKSSQMLADPRAAVPAWRWELELQPAQKNVRMSPLFTFESVAPQPLAR